MIKHFQETRDIMKAELGAGNTTPRIPLQNPTFFNTPHSSILSGALKGCLGSLDGACIEKLLLHCASALESNDVTLAQQVMWVLNNVASPVGDPNQRLTSWFLRALISRVSSVCPIPMNLSGSSPAQQRLMTVTEIAGYVDLIPWHRFGFCASNSAIVKAIQGYKKVHILDLSITHCMQWPTLIDALAKRPEGPPSVRISVPSWRPPVPPLLNVTSEEVGQRLGKFAKFKDIPFEFHVFGGGQTTLLPSINSPCITPEESYHFQYDLILNQLTPSALNLRDDEALVVNCQNWIRYLPNVENKVPHDISCRDIFLEAIKDLNPRIVTVVDEDSDLGALNLASRITACFNYLWIPFDALETFLSKENSQRIEYEADIGHKIENILAFEGSKRVERLECGVKFSQRMRNGGFLSIPFGEDTIGEVKFLLDQHASGWGMKKEEDMLVLTWKGHNSVYATAWVPCGFEEIE